LAEKCYTAVREVKDEIFIFFHEKHIDMIRELLAFISNEINVHGIFAGNLLNEVTLIRNFNNALNNTPNSYKQLIGFLNNIDYLGFFNSINYRLFPYEKVLDSTVFNQNAAYGLLPIREKRIKEKMKKIKESIAERKKENFFKKYVGLMIDMKKLEKSVLSVIPCYKKKRKELEKIKKAIGNRKIMEKECLDKWKKFLEDEDLEFRRSLEKNKKEEKIDITLLLKKEQDKEKKEKEEVEKTEREIEKIKRDLAIKNRFVLTEEEKKV